MLKQLKIPVGVSDFRKIRENGYYYMDKSGLIEELLKTDATEVTLITRPRRFGKTLGMSMLDNFLDIRKDSRYLFSGLKISQNQELCRKWMNQWPTLFLSFKDVDGSTFENAMGLLKFTLSQICIEHQYLEESSRVNPAYKQIFTRLKEQTGTFTDVQSSLLVLMRMMKEYYKKPVILLLDEYDVPMAKASSNGYYEKMLEVIKTMMSTALKDNESLRFAVVTGCLRIAKESIFTGTNNFTTDTISDIRYDEFFGFTRPEVAEFLKEAGCQDCQETVRKWYDGYIFGNIEIYCPWDVLNYVQRVLTEGVKKPENFWEHTSDNKIIELFLKRRDFDVTEKFEKLLNGEAIRESVNENVSYDFLTSTEENLWSLLYLTGYLTKVREETQEELPQERNKITLKIPNAEIQDIFRKSVLNWLQEKNMYSDRKELFEALWKGDSEKLTELISDLLFDTISYHDYAESFYHAFLAGLFSGAGYVVESNHESGLGRPDLVIKDKVKRRAAVLEIKVSRKESELKRGCEKALVQIQDRQYRKKIEASGFKTVLSYGVAFFQKSCRIMSHIAWRKKNGKLGNAD